MDSVAEDGTGQGHNKANNSHFTAVTDGPKSTRNNQAPTGGVNWAHSDDTKVISTMVDAGDTTSEDVPFSNRRTQAM